jgi:hypothetical protein
MYVGNNYICTFIWNSSYNCMFGQNNLIKHHSCFEISATNLLKLPAQRLYHGNLAVKAPNILKIEGFKNS